MIGSGVVGKLFSNFDGHKILIASISTISLSHLLVPIIKSLSLLFIVFLILGIGGGTIELGGNTLLLWIWGSKVQPYIQVIYM